MFTLARYSKFTLRSGRSEGKVQTDQIKSVPMERSDEDKRTTHNLSTQTPSVRPGVHRRRYIS